MYVGMRNWHPYLKDTLARMAADGVRRAVGVLAAAHRSYSSCKQYQRERGRCAHGARRRQAGGRRGHLRRRLVRTPAVRRGERGARHARRRRASRQLCRIARGSSSPRTASRSQYGGAVSVPAAVRGNVPPRCREGERRSCWCPTALRDGVPEPERPAGGSLARARHLRLPARGARRRTEAAVLCPIGFIVDHIEVLYDLDIEASTVAREIGLPIDARGNGQRRPAFPRHAGRRRSGRPSGGMPAAGHSRSWRHHRSLHS